MLRGSIPPRRRMGRTLALASFSVGFDFLDWLEYFCIVVFLSWGSVWSLPPFYFSAAHDPVSGFPRSIRSARFLTACRITSETEIPIGVLANQKPAKLWRHGHCASG